MLKAVPNKNAGFIILLTSILIFFLFGEIRNLTTFTRLIHYNNGSSFSISSFFSSIICFLWIGAQLPQEKFISYGRILTLDYYYFIIMCILVSLFLIFSTHNNIYYINLFNPLISSLPTVGQVKNLRRETYGVKVISGSVCKVRTQDTDNFDEGVKPLASAR